jgi:uncharacterized beta-barrel protein YwiB (DUF1934 family)
MKVEVEVKSTQIIDEKENIIKQNGIGEINKFENGSILVWDVKEEVLHFQMTILKEKILLKKQEQNMIFDLKRTTKSILTTQYGILSMDITTKNIDITMKEELIKKIRIEYNIEIENITKYKNIVEIKINSL